MAKKEHRETLLLKYGSIAFIAVVAFITAFQFITTQMTKKTIADIYTESVESYMNLLGSQMPAVLQCRCLSNQTLSMKKQAKKSAAVW